MHGVSASLSTLLGLRELCFPAWLLSKGLEKHLVTEGLHVLPKSFGKVNQNWYSVLFQR